MSFAVLVILALLPSSTAFGECFNHGFVEDADWSMSYTSSFGHNCDKTLTPGWYRFRGEAGTMMPTSCVPINRCGGQVTGWFYGRLPTLSEGVIQAQVCYHWKSQCCLWSSQIWVRSCGSFYVYYLQSVPFCTVRSCGNESHGSKWKYGETVSTVYGPKDWNKVSHHCVENAQSPINIVTRNARYALFLRGFSFAINSRRTSLNGKLVNNGHAPTFKIDGGTALLTGGPWGSGQFKLEQLHIHFGCTAREGSEHTVNSIAYSGELHMVFYNTKYQDFKTAADKADGLTVIGVLLTENDHQANAELKKLSNAMRKVTKADVNVKVSLDLNPYTLVPGLSDLSKQAFFSYKGSLTTPPCYQSVNWIVLGRLMHASKEMMDAMRSLKDHEGHRMCNNFRPTQPLNGRIVTVYAY